MKFLLTLLLIFHVNLLSDEDSVTQEKRSYQEAKILFEKKEYQKSYDEFYRLFQSNLQDPNINFYLGRSAYMLKDFGSAISAYERVLDFDANSTRSKLEIARCYFELQEYEKAQTLFLKISREDIPTNVKENIQSYLSAIDSKLKKNSLNASVVFGLNYDTNIANRANNDVYSGMKNVFLNTLSDVNNTTADKAGLSHQEALSLNHRYNFSKDIAFKNDVVVFSKTVTPAHEYDIALAQYSPALSVLHNSKVLVDYAFIFNKIWLNSKPYMTMYGIYPKFNYLYSNATMLGFNLRYQRKSIDLATTDIGALEFTLNHRYNDELMLAFYSEFYKEKRLSGNFIDYDMFNVALSTSYRYTPMFTITPKVQWYNRSYQHEDRWFPATQQDNEYQISLSGIYSYTQNLLFNLEYSYIRNDSNLPNFEFNKQMITSNVIVLF